MTIYQGLYGWPAAPAKDTDIQIFDVAGTYQWTKPAGAKWVKVTCIGAGCGGASGGKYGNFNSVKTYLDGTGLAMRGLNGQPAASNLASIPDNTAHRPTGDFELIVKMSSDDWTPSTTRGIIWNGTGASGATLNYTLLLNTNGTLSLLRPTGATSRNYASTALGLTDGSTKWIRVVFDADNGAGSSAATFYTSDNGTTWTTLNTATTANTTAGNSVASPFRVGSDGSVTNMLAGKIYQVKMISDPLGTPVTVVNINFETQPADTLTFTESSSNAATVTITQAGANKGGGGGGGGGAVSVVEFAADALPGSVPVTVGKGTNGGARQTTNTAAGNNGINGGAATTTSFGTYCGAQSSNAGTGGSNSGGAGTGVQSAGLFSSGAGLAGSITANVSVPAASNYVGGGTGGGGIDATDVIYSGGLGGGALIRPLSSGSSYLGLGGRGGTTDGVTPGDAQDGRYGGGGGGGAAGINGIVDSGAGGRGGDGVCIVTTYTGTAIDIQDFTASGTWRKPADPRLTTATVFVLGAGGGGGSGRLGAGSSTRNGGGGGGSAGVSAATFPLSSLSDQVAVTVGALGTGGTSIVTANTNGFAGSTGGTSSFGAAVFAWGGKGGSAGSGIGGVAPAGVAGIGSTFSGSAGGAGGDWTTTGGVGGTGSLTTGGGGGGQTNYVNNSYAAGAGGVALAQTGAVASGTPVNTSATEIASGAGFFGGFGGGGGNFTISGGNGARGSGGGGGGGGTNGGSSGAGGNGGNGRVVIVCR